MITCWGKMHAWVNIAALPTDMYACAKIQVLCNENIKQLKWMTKQYGKILKLINKQFCKP